jgi:hypothetical protein
MYPERQYYTIGEAKGLGLKENKKTLADYSEDS